jgi:phosphoserine aminotransferase
MPGLLNYGTVAANGSMLNTPNTWGIYLISLVCEWLREQGGVTEMEKLNAAKAALLYEAIDSSDGFYRGHADRSARSRMNVIFRLPSSELDDRFCSEAKMLGMSGLRGHRSVGGIRASIYNAFPRAGVERLVEFMKDFAARG